MQAMTQALKQRVHMYVYEQLFVFGLCLRLHLLHLILHKNICQSSTNIRARWQVVTKPSSSNVKRVQVRTVEEYRMESRNYISTCRKDTKLESFPEKVMPYEIVFEKHIQCFTAVLEK